MEENIQLNKLKLRIPYNEDDFESLNDYETMLLGLLEDSRCIALSEIYPYEDWYEMELPKKYLNWQIRASIELYQRAGTEGIKSYSENGLSWTRSTDLLSQNLTNELIPKASAPKRSDLDNE